MRGSTLIRLARALLGLAALAVGLLLLAGFIGQFLNAARYPWVIAVRDYTRPLAQLINNLIPTVYRGVDLLLVIALVPVWVLRAVAARGLEQAENRLYVRRPPLRPAAKAVEPTAAEPEQRQAAASPGRGARLPRVTQARCQWEPGSRGRRETPTGETRLPCR